MEARTARSIQQEFADLCGRGGFAIWDLYDENSKNSLKQKIKLIFPEVTTDIDSIRDRRDLTQQEKNAKIIQELEKDNKENEKLDEVRDVLFEAIWSQKKYYGGKLLMSILYIVKTKEIDGAELHSAEDETDFSCHPLFRIRKCTVGEASIDCCMIFVDECGRVYQNWADYKRKNILPEGVLIAPRNGIYNIDSDGNVRLENVLSPASTAESKLLNATDTGASILGLAASVAPVASLFTPVGPIVLAASLIAGAGVGAWSIGRSAYNLVDRSGHEQSINVTNREARASWLGVGAGAIGLGASGATTALAKSSAAGRNISKIALGTVNTLNMASILVNGISLTNGAIELILKKRDGDAITLLDCVQMSASLVLFTHSAYNFQTASQIVQSTRDNTIKGFRDELSKRQRKIFDKMARATISAQGAEQGKIDIIRSLRSIPDKKMYFSDVKRSAKTLGKNNIKPSFGPDGSVLLNNDVPISSTILQRNLQETPNVILSKVISAPIEQTSESIDIVNQLKKNEIKSVNLIKTAVNIVKEFSVQNDSILLTFLSQIYSKLDFEAAEKLVSSVKSFLQKYGKDIAEFLRRTLPYEEVLYEAYRIISKTVSCVNKISQFIIETSQLDIGTLIYKYYDHLIELIQEKLVLICSEFRISNLDDLRNCLLHLFESLTQDAAHKILQVAESLFTSDELEMIKSVKNFVEFDQFLFDVYTLTLGLVGAGDNREELSTNVLRLDNERIEMEARHFYQSFSANLGKKIKCKICSGSYFLNE